jgi:hypothetical protein
MPPAWSESVAREGIVQKPALSKIQLALLSGDCVYLGVVAKIRCRKVQEGGVVDCHAGKK